MSGVSSQLALLWPSTPSSSPTLIWQPLVLSEMSHCITTARLDLRLCLPLLLLPLLNPRPPPTLLPAYFSTASDSTSSAASAISSSCLVLAVFSILALARETRGECLSFSGLVLLGGRYMRLLATMTGTLLF